MFIFFRPLCCLCFFFRPLCCLCFFDLRILITPLVSSNSSNSLWSRTVWSLIDIKSVSKAVYRRRRRTYPSLPKSREETHENLSKMNIQTSKDEDFLKINDVENGLVIFIPHPIILRTVYPSGGKQTNNGTEFFHAHFNG